MTESNHNNKSRIDEYIENNDCQINESVPVIIKGEKKNLSVYRLPIDLLYYNIRNGRFAAEYRNEIKKEGGVLIPEEKEDAKKIQNLLWNLKRIEIFSEHLGKEKLVGFKANDDQLFSIIKNYKLYQLLYKDPIYPKNLYLNNKPMKHKEYKSKIIDKQIKLMHDRGIWVKSKK